LLMFVIGFFSGGLIAFTAAALCFISKSSDLVPHDMEFDSDKIEKDCCEYMHEKGGNIDERA